MVKGGEGEHNTGEKADWTIGVEALTLHQTLEV